MEVCDLNPFLRFAAKLRYDLSYNNTDVRVNDCRIFFILEGGARLRVEQNTYDLTPGCLFFCRAGSRYVVHARESMQLISLNFDLTQQHRDHTLPFSPNRNKHQWDTMSIHFDAVSDSSFLNGHLFLENAGDLLPLLEQITGDFSSGDRFARELSSAGLKTLLTRLHRRDPARLPPKLLQVQEHIQKHYARDLTNRELADLVGYHEYYLNRIFTASTGQSLHSYLLNVRLSRASFLILNTDTPLQEIPEQVGFGSYPHFSAAFKRMSGFSPSQYRKHLRGSI